MQVLLVEANSPRHTHLTTHIHTTQALLGGLPGAAARAGRCSSTLRQGHGEPFHSFSSWRARSHTPSFYPTPRRRPRILPLLYTPLPWLPLLLFFLLASLPPLLLAPVSFLLYMPAHLKHPLLLPLLQHAAALRSAFLRRGRGEATASITAWKATRRYEWRKGGREG